MDWCFRLEHEHMSSRSACFLTLTYEEPPLSENGLPTLRRSHLTKFLKRLRKTTHEKLKYYAVGEYGTQFKRPHYHIILFNYPWRILLRHDPVLSVWKSGQWDEAVPGHIQIDACTPGSIGYVANYCQVGTWQSNDCPSTGLIDDRLPHFSVMSKKMGLSYLTPQKYQYHIDQLANFITRPGGAIQRLPRYFRDKIFTKTERLQIQKEYEELTALDVDELFQNGEHEVDYKKMLIYKHNLKQKVR